MVCMVWCDVCCGGVWVCGLGYYCCGGGFCDNLC